MRSLIVPNRSSPIAKTYNRSENNTHNRQPPQAFALTEAPPTIAPDFPPEAAGLVR
jgi:hypothetical protein